MLNEKVAALCNQQINKEFYSAYLYLDIANYYADQGLDGFANWYTIQAQEERDHAMLFLQYVTALINGVYGAAYETKDYRTMQFLDWFVKEQGEEEKNADDLLKKYDLYGSDPKGLYSLNSELAARVYSAPSLVL